MSLAAPVGASGADADPRLNQLPSKSTRARSAPLVRLISSSTGAGPTTEGTTQGQRDPNAASQHLKLDGCLALWKWSSTAAALGAWGRARQRTGTTQAVYSWCLSAPQNRWFCMFEGLPSVFYVWMRWVCSVLEWKWTEGSRLAPLQKLRIAFN